MDTAARTIKASEAARIIGCSSAAIRAWVRKGHLPALRLPGGQLRIHEADLALVWRPALDRDVPARRPS